MMPRCNQRRASCAHVALNEYMSRTGSTCLAEAFVDLIADLGHFADSKGFDFLHLTETGIGHWYSEQETSPRPDRQPHVAVIVDHGGLS